MDDGDSLASECQLKTGERGTDQTPTTSDLNGYNAGWDQSVPLPDATADDSPKPEEQPKKEEKKQP